MFNLLTSATRCFRAVARMCTGASVAARSSVSAWCCAVISLHKFVVTQKPLPLYSHLGTKGFQLLSLSVAAALSWVCFSLCILAALRSWIGLGSLPLEKRKKCASCWHRTGILVVFNHGVPGFYVDH